jgi:hypothetical protein
VENLHTANRVRHELEVRLHAELEAAFRLKKTLEEKVLLINDMELRIENFELQKRADAAKLQEAVDQQVQ